MAFGFHSSDLKFFATHRIATGKLNCPENIVDDPQSVVKFRFVMN